MIKINDLKALVTYFKARALKIPDIDF